MGSVSELGYFQKRKERRSARFPKVPLISVFLLLSFAIGAVLFGQTTGIGTIKNAIGAPVAIRDIVLSKSEGDVVVVTDARSGQVISEFAPQEGGFVRGSLRALERMRLVSKIPQDHPYRVIKWENGAVSLSDTATGERLYLNAFGKDNAAAFEKFLELKTAGVEQ